MIQYNFKVVKIHFTISKSITLSANNFWIGSVAPAEFCKALADDSFLNALGVFGSLGASRSTCIDFENMMTTGWLEKSKWKSWEIKIVKDDYTVHQRDMAYVTVDNTA